MEGGPKDHINIHLMLIQVLELSSEQQQRNCYIWESGTSTVLFVQLRKEKDLNHHITCASKIGQDHPHLWKQIS